MTRSGICGRVTGVVTVASLFVRSRSAPKTPSSAIENVLLIIALVGDAITLTAKTRLPLLPPSPPPGITAVHVVPAAPLAQLHHDVLAAALNVVLAGMIAVTTTPVAFCLLRLL